MSLVTSLGLRKTQFTDTFAQLVTDLGISFDTLDSLVTSNQTALAGKASVASVAAAQTTADNAAAAVAAIPAADETLMWVGM